MTASRFVERFGGIYEHSTWVAERVYALLGDRTASTETLARLMADCVDNASHERQLALIRAHPDLAGKIMLADELTAESSEEQSSAGLDQCNEDEYEEFQRLNSLYKEKFGFPFVMAVRQSRRSEILAAFASRIDNERDVEFETALREIHKIARLRLAALGGAT